VWGGAEATLRAAGHDVVWAGSWDEDPGDEEILARANEESRVLVTLDKDFGELAIVRGQAHRGIIRIVDFPAAKQAAACMQVLADYATQVAEGGWIFTVEPAEFESGLPTSTQQSQIERRTSVTRCSSALPSAKRRPGFSSPCPSSSRAFTSPMEWDRSPASWRRSPRGGSG